MMNSPQELKKDIPLFIEQVGGIKRAFKAKTRKETKKRIEQALSQKRTEIQWTGSREESGVFLCGSKENFPTLLSFLYLGTHYCTMPENKIKEILISHFDNSDEADESLPLSESDFYNHFFFSDCFKWLNHENFPWEDIFVQGVLLSEDWNDISLIAEFETQFILMSWGTGA